MKSIRGYNSREYIMPKREFKRYIDGLIQFHEYFKESVKKRHEHLTGMIPRYDVYVFHFKLK